MSNVRQERSEDQRRRAIYAGNKGISRAVWDEAMQITRRSEQARRRSERQQEQQEHEETIQP